MSWSPNSPPLHMHVQETKADRKEKAQQSSAKDTDASLADESGLDGAREKERGGGVITRDDARIRRVPFATARPTFHELRRTVLKLVALEFVALEDLETVKEPLSGAKHSHGEKLQTARASGSAKDKGSKDKGKAKQGTSGVQRTDAQGEGDDDEDESDGEMHECHTSAGQNGEGGADGEDDKAASKVCLFHDTSFHFMTVVACQQCSHL